MSTNSRFFRQSPLGLNYRNFLIRERNPVDGLRRVKDKSGFKAVLQANSIATPQTYELIHDFSDVQLISTFPEEFVIKPDRGFGGKGVILLQRRGEAFINPSGDVYSVSALKRHLRKILDGDFSSYVAQDMALIEERVYPSEELKFKDSYGLPDIRIFCARFGPVMAMLRYPTFKSKGRSNLTAGGIGVGLDLATGKPTFIHAKGGASEPRPEDIGIPAAFAMPQWAEMKDVAHQCSRLAGLWLTGVDIILDASDRVRVLEVNGRPGLEIQNINEASLLEKFEAL